MTMSREVNSRETKNRRRALASVRSAVDRTSIAIKDQISVLSALRLQIQEINELDHRNSIENLADIQLKASNEVKKLHSLINQLVQLRSHLSNEDPQDRLVAPILTSLNSLEATAQDETNAYINELDQLKGKMSPLLHSYNSLETDASPNGLLLHFTSLDEKNASSLSHDTSSEFCDLSTEAKEVMHERSTTIQLAEEIEHRRKLARAWKTLQRDVHDLNDTFKRFAASVWIQGRNVDRIEENVASSTGDLNRGAITLSKITKTSALPLIGAAVGTAFAGPIGFVAGYKLAAIAAVGTASIGYYSGKAVEKVIRLPAIEPPPPIPATSKTSDSPYAVDDESQTKWQENINSSTP